MEEWINKIVWLFITIAAGHNIHLTRKLNKLEKDFEAEKMRSITKDNEHDKILEKMDAKIDKLLLSFEDVKRVVIDQKETNNHYINETRKILDNIPNGPNPN
jgi:hypothetical protein